MKFNINHYVKVRLTDLGRQCLKDNFKANNRFEPGILNEYEPPEEDKNGWSLWQLWKLMSEFGDHIYNGAKLPFEPNIKIIGEIED